MRSGLDIGRLLERLEACQASMTALEILIDETRQYGLLHVAVGELPSAGNLNLRPFFYSNWPKNWFDFYVTCNIGAEDPIVRIARETVRPFSWTEIYGEIDNWNINGGELRAFEALFDYGWNDGFAVPVHGPGNYCGLVSFASREMRMTEEDRLIIRAMALQTHDRMLELHRGGSDDAAKPVRAAGLTARESEVIELLAQGLTDQEVARRIGISERTALHYVQTSRKKLGCRTRAQLVAEAIGRGVISP